jgi:hypothetical protein
MIYTKFEFVLSFPASLLSMSLDFDVISYVNGKGHLLAMRFWLYLFLLLQCPHRGVVAASSSAPVPTTIGTKFES